MFCGLSCNTKRKHSPKFFEREHSVWWDARHKDYSQKYHREVYQTSKQTFAATHRYCAILLVFNLKL